MINNGLQLHTVTHTTDIAHTEHSDSHSTSSSIIVTFLLNPWFHQFNQFNHSTSKFNASLLLLLLVLVLLLDLEHDIRLKCQ